MRPSLLLFALLLAAPAAAADRVPLDRLRAAVTAEAPRGEALLERLVNQNSGTLNAPGVQSVADTVRTELEQLGFRVRWVDMSATGRAGHLVATHRGKERGKRVLLIGHLDTVFEPSSPFQRFARDPARNRATGPGVTDDKGGIVVIVGALRAMQAAGTLARANVTVVLTGDEERPGQPTDRARADLIAAGKAADAALEFEPLAAAGGKDYATIARRSGSAWALEVTARSGHSAGVFGGSYGAIYELARILDTFRRELIEPHATFNVGLVAGGTPAQIDPSGVSVSATGKTNIIASRAIARGDLRTLTPEQDARLRARMGAIVADHLPGTDATFGFYDTTPPVAPSPGNQALLGELNAVNAALGLPAMEGFDPDQRGAADSGFVAADVAVIGGMGVSGGGTHGDGEWIDLASLPRQTLRAAALISRLTAQRR